MKRLNKKAYLSNFKNIKRELESIRGSISVNEKMTMNEKLKEINKFNRFNKMVDLVVNNLSVATKTALDNINNLSNEIYKTNYDYIADKLGGENTTKKETKKEIKNNQDPYNTVSMDDIKDRENSRVEVKRTLLPILLNGLSINIMSKVYEKKLTQSNILGTNNTTRLENLSRNEAMIESERLAEKEGYVLVKVWNSRKDKKVRDAHARADGQEAQLDKPFYVGGEYLMYPGDPNGSAGNVINCRCYITYKKVAK